MRVHYNSSFPSSIFFCERGGHNDDVDMWTVRFPEMKGKTLINFNCMSYCPGFFIQGFVSLF